jgi:5-methylcytosine-specific restriction endonuclease McrA
VIEYVQVKDFDRFQHYKDRDPPWIKLYVRILQDYAFGTLPDAQKAHLMLIWVLASRMDNKIPKDPVFVKNQIGANATVDLDALMAAGFLQPWSESSARGKREEWPSRYVSAQIRTDLLSAAQHHCASCPATEHLEIDHIVPISKGGTGDPDNLQVLCRKCNRKKRALLRTASAEHLRSEPLRRTTDPRSPETETETEKNKQAVVLDHYRKVHPKRLRGDVPEKTQRLLRKALKHYTTADLCQAIDGNAGDQFCRDGNHMGLDLILRDADHIDRYMAKGAEPETVEMTDEWGAMRLHRRDPVSGAWVAVA